MSLMLAAIDMGNYVSPIKLVIFAAMFILLLPLTGWVYSDAIAVRTKKTFWTAMVFGSCAAALVLWLIIPIYLVGAALFILAGASTTVLYVAHRNTRVNTAEKMLISNFFKRLFENKKKAAESAKDGLTYTTANKNEVPIPEANTVEYGGFKAANSVFDDAIWRRAQEIRFMPTAQNYLMSYIIDGVEIKQTPRAKEEIDLLFYFLKSLADLDINEKRKPQKGMFLVRRGNKSVQWELTTAGSTAGEHVKLLQIEAANIKKIEELGLNPEQVGQLTSVRSIPGVFIISGPRKSGVSTTFYAMLKGHDPFLNSIVTLEKQLAAEVPNITQNTFSLSDTGTTTFAKRLQTLLRMGPDILGATDIDDAQTAAVLCTAAKSGLHVYITMEADNAVTAVAKWMKLVNDPTLATETLVGVTNQRLIRVLCTECKQAYEPNKDLLKKFNIPAEKVKTLYRAGEALLDKKGRPIVCPNCQSTGFYGRIATFESVIMNDELRTALKQAKSLQDIAGSFRRGRMLFLQEQALRKVVDGTTAISELIREFAAKNEKPQAPAKPAAPAAKA